MGTITSKLTCTILFLIAVIQTIIVSVTDPALGDAALVVASEVPGMRTGLHWRLRVGIRYAGGLVRSQLLPIRTTAFYGQRIRVVPRYSEAELLTVPVVPPARLHGIYLLDISAEDFDSVQPVSLRFPDHDFFLFSSQLVQSHDGVQSPVSYVHKVFVDHDGEGMSDQS